MNLNDILSGSSSLDEFKQNLKYKAVLAEINSGNFNCSRNISNNINVQLDRILDNSFMLPARYELSKEEQKFAIGIIKKNVYRQLENYKNYLDEVFGKEE